MKKLIPLILLLFLFVSCKPTLNCTIKEPIYSKTENCPINGNCTIELIPNKSIEFKTDNFGILYPVISEGTNTLLKYTYKRNPIENTQDSNYTELIYAELDEKITELELTDEHLKNAKLYFGRLCFCKGETGYYPIKKGNFKISKSGKNSINIQFHFSVKEVPQIISKIDEIISLKSN